MEFHNVKLLPKGLPEIIAQFVPYDIYPDTKVIVYPRKLARGIAGAAGYDDMTRSYHIRLYPTILSFYAWGEIGTYSFKLWFSYLKTALHEIGHLATRTLIEGKAGWIDKSGTLVGCDTREHFYVEGLANEWMQQAMAQILQGDSRLGQPNGALTGYPGMNAYRLRNWGRPWNNGEYDHFRQAEWRGLSCGGQVTINDIAKKLMLQERLGYEVPLGDWVRESARCLERWIRASARCRRAVHRAAKELRIERYFTNKNGRRYLMFNAGEAEAVFNRLK